MKIRFNFSGKERVIEVEDETTGAILTFLEEILCVPASGLESVYERK
jgi:hypothetical protein